jgi:hypothetical protein
MQGLYKKTMGALVTAEQQVYYLNDSSAAGSYTHNDWVEFTVDEDGKACVQGNDTQEESIQEELLLEEEE